MVYGGFTSAAAAAITPPVTVAFFPVIFQQIKLLISCLKTLTKTILISRRNLFLLPSVTHLFVLSLSFFVVVYSYYYFFLFMFWLSRQGWLCHYHFFLFFMANSLPFFSFLFFAALSRSITPRSFSSLLKLSPFLIAFSCNFSHTC